MFDQASAFNHDIGSWNTAQVTDMEYMFYPLLRSTKTFPRGPDPRRRRRKLTCLLHATAFQANLRAPTPSTVRRVRARVPRASRTRVGTLSLQACLAESGAEVTGECTTWVDEITYGTMPNWDTSLVEGYEWMDWKCVLKALVVKVHSMADISNVGHSESD